MNSGTTLPDPMPGPELRQVRLRWTGSGLAFEGGPDDGVQVAIDGDGKLGQTPTQALLMALAGCMAIDVVMILQKSRVQLDGLEIEAVGERADMVPARFVAIRLVCDVKGPGPEDRGKVDRAVELSRDRYCSVLHTLDPEMEVDVRVRLA